MKKTYLIILSLISAGLLIASFPLKQVSGSAADLCRLIGFILLFFTTALRVFRKS